MSDRIESTNAVSRASQCEGKVAFRSLRQSRQAAKRREGRVVYKCHHCHHWHVGTPEPKPKKFAKRKKLIQLFLETEFSHD